MLKCFYRAVGTQYLMKARGLIMKKPGHSKLTLIAAVLLALAAAALLLFFCVIFPRDMRRDFKRLYSESYDTVVLSMYPMDNCPEDRYTYWRGMDTVVTTHEIPNLFTLKCYLKLLGRKGTVTNVYLGVLPEMLDAAELAGLLLAYPGTRFEVILPYPQLDYWLSLPREECDSLLQAYRDFIPPLLNHEMISPYFFGSAEWLISNPANYEGTFETNAQASETIMLHSDRDHEYVLTADSKPSPTACIDDLDKLISSHRKTPVTYPDLSGWNIVFFGDSVIGNYTGTTSIPCVTAGLTGARVYNLGLGGGSASKFPNREDYALTDIIHALLTQTPEALPSDTQVYLGMKELLADAPNGQYCFVINYGLNDYFAGAPIASQDPYDLYTYSGAYRTAISELREAYPDCYIILDTPNFCINFNYGMDYRFDVQHTMIDYVDTLQIVAAEFNVGLLDNYNELGITKENFGTYLADGTHPNETGRFLIGKRIALKLGEMLSP